jgi:proton glutamate symport protein
MDNVMTVLKSPITLVVAFVISVFLCVYAPSVALAMQIPGNIYISTLQVCITPLLMSSLIKSMLLIVSTKNNSFNLSKIASLFFIFLPLMAVCGIILAKAIPLGTHIAESSNFSDFFGIEYGLKPAYVTIDEPLNVRTTLINLIQSIFTANIFESLNESLLIQIIFFSILFGCAVGHLPEDKKNTFLNLTSSTEAAFKKIISWILQLLPIGVVCIFSYRFLSLSVKILKLLTTTVIFSALSMIAISLILNFFIAKKLKTDYFSTFLALKDPLIIATSTGSPTSSLPTYLTSLSNNLKLDKNAVDLFGPVSLATCRYGNVFYYTLLSIITAQMFSVPLTLEDYLLIVAMSVFTGFSAVSTGIINISLLSIILSSVGVPSALAIILFAAIDPLIDPVRTFFTVYVNAFCSAMSFPREN